MPEAKTILDGRVQSRLVLAMPRAYPTTGQKSERDGAVRAIDG